MEKFSKINLAYAERMAWFHQARFGMFIHFGLYSVLSRGEWVMTAERIPKEEYAKLAQRFNPTDFSADAWVKLAQEAGIKYMTLTTRHHDGFCLFDSKVSDFTSVKTAAKRDFVAEYVTACRKAGMKVGLYYSLPDWRFPGYYEGREKNPASTAAMVKQAHSQVKELMSGYGQIDLLWYDLGGPMSGVDVKDVAQYWRAKELNRTVRELQPEIIINNRSGLDEDFDTPEGQVTASKEGRAWEAAMSMGDACGWGYVKHNPNFKSTTQLIQYLVTAAAGEGNFLLNIGPKPDGSVREEEVERLREIGRWMKVNGESIYGSQRVPTHWGGGGPHNCGMLGKATAKGDTVYLHVFRWPGETAAIPGVKNKVVSARVLATGEPAEIEQTADGHLFLKGLPLEPPDPDDTVILLELDGKPEAYNYEGIPLL